MYLMLLYAYILLGSVLVYSKTTVKEVEVTGVDSNGNFIGKNVHSNVKGFVKDDSNSVESWKKSLMNFMGSKRDEQGFCFGTCISNSQCYDFSGGNPKCRCSFFACQLAM
jgi:hypothetical protein